MWWQSKRGKLSEPESPWMDLAGQNDFAEMSMSRHESPSQDFNLRLQPGFRVGLANLQTLNYLQVAKHFGVQTNLSNSLGLDGISRSFLSQTSKSLLRHLQENADAHHEVSLRALRQEVQQESKKDQQPNIVMAYWKCTRMSWWSPHAGQRNL